MLSAQGGRCASCGSDDPRDRRGWHVEHDHGIGLVRGITCRPCNLTIGNAKEDIARLRACADYLEKHNASR